VRDDVGVMTMAVWLCMVDPRAWSRADVYSWLESMRSGCDVDVDVARFRMNGKALCLMSRDMFTYRVPRGGSLLYVDFQLRLCRAVALHSGAVVDSAHQSSTSQDSTLWWLSVRRRSRPKDALLIYRQFLVPCLSVFSRDITRSSSLRRLGWEQLTWMVRTDHRGLWDVVNYSVTSCYWSRVWYTGCANKKQSLRKNSISQLL